MKASVFLVSEKQDDKLEIVQSSFCTTSMSSLSFPITFRYATLIISSTVGCSGANFSIGLKSSICNKRRAPALLLAMEKRICRISVDVSSELVRFQLISTLSR